MDSNDREPQPNPPQVLEFVERLAIDVAHDGDGTEDRELARHKLVMPVLVQPMDGNLEPVGEAFAAVTRDISATGIGLLHTSAIEATYVRLQLKMPSGRAVELTAQVLRCRPLGRSYEIDARLVARISRGE